MAARREEALREAAAECEQYGARTLVVPTDMTDERAARELAERARAEFGRIDVWVNNHGVMLLGALDDTPLPEFRRVLEVDFFGTVNGTRAVLPIFRAQGRGVLINTGSMDSRLAQPYASAYAAAKHAVRGFGMSLRQELSVQGLRDISVCTVMPATIDTPLFQHAANYTGRAVKAMPPVYSPERVARAIIRLTQRPRTEVFVGNVARMLWLQYLLAPAATERLVGMMADKLQLDPKQAAPTSQGNLFQPMPGGTGISGGWKTLSGANKAKTNGDQGSIERILAIIGMAGLALGFARGLVSLCSGAVSHRKKGTA